MKKVLIAFSLLLSACMQGQQLSFPAATHRDSVSLLTGMPSLAKKVIAGYKQTSKETYLDNLFRINIVAGEYTTAVQALDSLLVVYNVGKDEGAKGIGFQFRIYSLAKQQQPVSGKPLDKIIDSLLNQLYPSLSLKAQPAAASYFETDVQPLRNSFYQLLGKYENKDSISIEEAVALCRAYNSYTVYKEITKPGKAYLVVYDNSLYIIEDSVRIPTRDGASIAATIVRRRSVTAPLPVILSFNIYAGDVDKARAKNAANKGYVGIMANTRGKRVNTGDIEPFEHDGSDAYDVIDWISKQPWCNGKVGMYGGSYLGFSQWAAVKKVHPALKTIIPQVAVGIGIDYPMTNNVFMSYMLQWIHYVTNNRMTDAADFNNSVHWDSAYNQWYASGRSFRSLDTIEGRPNPIFQRWLQHPSHDSYWQNMVAYQKDFSDINIPILTTTGYFDDDQLGAMYYFHQHHLHNKKANHYLLIGPYNHGGAQSTPSADVSGYTIDSVANFSITELAFQWFNYILKDSSKPAILKDRINYQVMGANQWKHAPSLDKITNDSLTFYFSNTRMGKHYKLVQAKPAQKEFIRQEVDYAYRGDTVNFYLPNLINNDIITGQSLSFISEPFDKPVEITGAFRGEVEAILNKKDLDLSVQLYELLPDGKYFTLNSFLGRASYTKNRSKRTLLRPGISEKIPFRESFFTSRQLQKGSRLVILIGVNKNPYWQVNYGSGKDVSDETIADGKIPLQIQWFNSSYIKVPVWKQ